MKTSRAAKRKRSLGFTLVELLVVLLILGLACAATAHVMYRRSPDLELRATASEVAAAFREARSLAIRSNSETVVTIDLDSRTFSVGESGGEQAIPPDLGITLRTAASELKDEGVAAIRFFPDGSSTGGRVTLFTDRHRYHVVAEWITGRIDVQQ